jgi:hypothetical protein
MGPSMSLLTLNGWDIPFVSSIKHLGVILDKKIVHRPNIEMIETKALKTSIRIYSLLKN